MTHEMIITDIENWAVNQVLERNIEGELEEKIADGIDPDFYDDPEIDHIRRLNTLSALILSEPIEQPAHEVSTFKSMRSAEVVGKRDVRSILYQILKGGDHKNLILEARAAGKHSEQYKDSKIKLPTVTFNGTFKDRRSTENLEKLSGLLYLDVDGTTDIDLDNPLIYASWRSFGNNGRGILAKVKGMTSENIKEVYEEVSQKLNIQDWVDNSCREISRQNVISYDPDLYVNGHSQTFRYEGDSKTPNSHTLKEKKIGNASPLGESYNDKKIRWNNLEDYDLQGRRYEYFSEKRMFVKVYLPSIKIETGRRHKVISALINNFLYLNPFSSNENTHRFMLSINERCIKPLDQKDLVRIYTRKLKELESGKLQPIENFERSFVFSKEVTKEERAKIVGYHVGLNRSEETRARIQDCLETWDLNKGKVTNRKIAEEIERCENTVSSYMKIFKPMKAELNRVIREEKKMNPRKAGKKNPSEKK